MLLLGELSIDVLDVVLVVVVLIVGLEVLAMGLRRCSSWRHPEPVSGALAVKGTG